MTTTDVTDEANSNGVTDEVMVFADCLNEVELDITTVDVATNVEEDDCPITGMDELIALLAIDDCKELLVIMVSTIDAAVVPELDEDTPPRVEDPRDDEEDFDSNVDKVANSLVTDLRVT